MTLPSMTRPAFSQPWPSAPSMLSDLASQEFREADKRAAWLIERAVAGLEAMVDQLFRDAFILWMTRSLVRDSDEEPSCMVVFYGCCLEVLSAQETALRIVYESAQPTRQMLAGLEHPKKAPRPDMSILYGSRYTIRVEAKRLMCGDSLPKQYVQEGMRRFIEEKYSSSQGKAGYLLGFVVRDETTDVVNAINHAILRESDFTAGDQLTAVTVPLQRFCRCESNHHSSELRLIHNFFDVRREALSRRR